MTDRVAPGAQGSTVRNMEYGEMGGAPAPFLVPYGKTTRSTERWSDLDEPLTNAASDRQRDGPFGIQYFSTDVEEMSFNPGEGFVDGWFIRDNPTTIDNLSDYEEEEVTFVVGWDPDAVYSSDIHDNREEADKVILDLEQNVDDDIPYIPIYRGVIIEQNKGGYGFAPNGEWTDLRPVGRPVETIESDAGQADSSNGPGVNLLRGRPTAFTGGVQTGPMEAGPNALRAEYATAPSNADAEQGDESLLTLLKSAGLPSVYVERVLDGEGGAYGNRLQSSLGRLPRVNANLSWEYDTFDDVPAWSSADGGESSWTFEVTDRPRRIVVEHDGSGSSDDHGGVSASVLSTLDSVGPFRITFHDVSFTQNGENRAHLAVSTASPDSDVFNTGDGFMWSRRQDDNEQLVTVDNGSNTTENADTDGSDWSTNHDISLEYDGSDVSLLRDGEVLTSSSYSVNADFKPVVQLQQDSGDGQSETIEVGQISIEPLPEVLN